MADKNINIALVSHSYPIKSDPTRSLFIKNEAHLIANEHHVELHLPSVISLPFKKNYRSESEPLEDKLTFHQATYVSIPRRKLSFITRSSISRALLTSIEKQQPDIVHLHALYPTGLSAKSISLRGYPVILTIHGGDWYYNLHDPKLMNRLLESLDYCNRIICVGKSLAKDISDYAPSIKDKIAHIPHGIDTAIFNPTEQVSDAKHTYNWNPDKSHILTVGNLFHVKGFDILLKAFAGLKPLSNYHLHLVTPREDSETRQEIDDIIMEKDLNDRITFYDKKTPNELAGFYRSADLFISSSRKEGFGLVVAEAIACGTPVIATMSGGPEEIITEETGRVSSIENLEESLKKTLPSLNKFDKLKLHNYIKCEFSTSSKKEKLNSLYASVLD